jgi:uncharacterized protein (TIGR02217 family)
MSNAVFPALPGQAFPVPKTAVWKTTVQRAISGPTTRIGHYTYPIWQWELSFDILRQRSTYTELTALANFFLNRQGQADTWLFTDPDDCQATGQFLGDGDGTKTAFQLIRSFGGVGGFPEPIWAPNTVSAVYVNGVVQAPSSYTVSAWGSAAPGVITFAAAPAAGAQISVDFTYYFVCVFTADKQTFTKFMANRYKAAKLTFETIKLTAGMLS